MSLFIFACALSCFKAAHVHGNLIDHSLMRLQMKAAHPHSWQQLDRHWAMHFVTIVREKHAINFFA